MVGQHVRVLKGDRWVHAIDCGDETVLHLVDEAPRRVRRAYRPEFVAGAGAVEIVTHRERTFPPKEIVRRAYSRASDPALAAIFRDSEAFAEWCATGRLAGSRAVPLEVPGAAPAAAPVAAPVAPAAPAAVRRVAPGRSLARAKGARAGASPSVKAKALPKAPPPAKAARGAPGRAAKAKARSRAAQARPAAKAKARTKAPPHAKGPGAARRGKPARKGRR
jgi:hypothetical protein